MQKANEKTKTNLLIVIKLFLSSLNFSKKKLLFRFNKKIGEKAKSTPNKKPAAFLDTVWNPFP